MKPDDQKQCAGVAWTWLLGFMVGAAAALGGFVLGVASQVQP